MATSRDLLASVPRSGSGLGIAGDWISDHWPGIASVAGSILLAVGCAWISIPASEWKKIDWIGSGSGRMVMLGIAIMMIGSIATFIQGDGAVKLKRRAEEAERARDSIQNAYSEFADQYRSIQQNIVKTVLRDIASNLHLGDSDRISLYGHNGRYFILAGRHSKHPEYSKIGRPMYPDNQGCIGKAWHNGDSFSDNLPDPTQDKRGWIRSLEKEFNIPKSTAEAFVMKSRCLVARAIELPGEARIAVLLIESVRVNRFSTTALRDGMNQDIASRLVSLLKIVATFEPNPEYARNEGY
jgi:hypothetical protein